MAILCVVAKIRAYAENTRGVTHQAGILLRVLYSYIQLAIMRSNIFRGFTPWTPWIQRDELELSPPGVYLLARSPNGRRPSKSSKLLYVGETCGQTLRGRLLQFRRSAFNDKRVHSGGVTFARKFRMASEPEWLYISVLGVTEKNKCTAEAYIRFVERALIWNHVREHGALPKCNVK